MHHIDSLLWSQLLDLAEHFGTNWNLIERVKDKSHFFFGSSRKYMVNRRFLSLYFFISLMSLTNLLEPVTFCLMLMF